MGSTFIPALGLYLGGEAPDLIVKAIIEDGQIKRVSYIPCYVNKRAEPEVVSRSDPRGREVFHYMEDISRSEDLPVHYSWEGDEVLISA